MDESVKKHERFVCQLIDTGYIHSGNVKKAFLNIRRHDFLPAHLQDQAYRDHAIAIKFSNENRGCECSSSCSQPSLTAMMLEWLDIRSGLSILDIGTGSGYTSALLCEATGSDDAIYSIDIDEELVELASQRLASYGFKPHVVSGDALTVLPFSQRFDRVLVTAGVPYIPECWIDHLNPEAILVLPFYWGGIDYMMKLAYKDSSLLDGRCHLVTFFTGLGKTRDADRAYTLKDNESTLTLYDFFRNAETSYDPEINERLDYHEGRTNISFSSTDGIEGFHLYTLVRQPFFHGGLQLAYSGSGGFGVGGYALYAYDPDEKSIIILPFESGHSPVIGFGDSQRLIRLLEKHFCEWEQLGKPKLTDYQIRFVFHSPEYLKRHPEGWHIRKEMNYMHITLSL